MDFLRAIEEDLRLLAAECRKKFPEVKDSAEVAMEKLKAIREKYVHQLSVEHAPSYATFRSPDILRPFLLAANHGDANSRILNISMSGLQRLITANNTSPSDIASIVRILLIQSESGNVDVQLKIMQTLVLLLTTNQNSEIDDEVLAQSLEICFRLHMVPKAIIHNSAAATLSQVITILFERVQAEHQQALGSSTSSSNSSSHAPTPSQVQQNFDSLSTSSRTVYLLFNDLCLQSKGQAATWLKKVTVPRDLGLDLIESILSEHMVLFRKKPAFSNLITEQVCPMLVAGLEREQELSSLFKLMKLAATVLTNYGDGILAQVEAIIVNFISILTKREEVDRKLDNTQGGVSGGTSERYSGSHKQHSKQSSQGYNPKTSESFIAEWRVTLSIEVLQRVCLRFDFIMDLFLFYDKSLTKPDLCEAVLVALVEFVQRTSLRGLGLSQASTAQSRPVDVLASSDIEHVVPDGHATFRQAVQCLVSLAEGLRGRVSQADTSKQTEIIDLRVIAQSMTNPLLAGFSSVLTHCENSPFLIDLALRGFFCLSTSAGLIDLNCEQNTILKQLCSFILSGKAQLVNRQTGGSSWKVFQCSRVLIDDLKALNFSLQDCWPFVLETLEELEQVASMKQTQVQPELDRDILALSTSLKAVFEDCKVWPQQVLVDAVEHVARYACANSGLPIPESLIRKRRAQTAKLPKADAPCLASAFQWLHGSSSLPDSLSNPIATAAAAAVAATAAAVGDTKDRRPPGLSKGAFALGAAYNLRPPSYTWIVPTFTFGAERPGTKTPPYALRRLLEVSRLNVFRIECIWPLIEVTLRCFLAHKELAVRQYVAESYAQLLTACLTSGNKHLETPLGPGDMTLQTRLLTVMQTCVESPYPDIHEASLQGLHSILQSCGHLIHTAWPTILKILQTVSDNASSTKLANAGQTDNTDPLESTAGSGLGSNKSFRTANQPPRVKMGFSSVQLIVDDFLPNIQTDHIPLCLSCVGSYCSQDEDLNVCLTAINGLWLVADFLNNSAGGRIEGKFDTEKQKISMKVFDELRRLAMDPRPEVRNCALNTLISTACALGGQFPLTQWRTFCQDVYFPLLQQIEAEAAGASLSEREKDEQGGDRGKSQRMMVHHSRDSAEKQWSETRVLAIQAIIRILRSFIRLLFYQDWFAEVWQNAINACTRALIGPTAQREVALAAIVGLQTLAQLVSTTGVPQGTTRVAAGMKVVDGALIRADDQAKGKVEKSLEGNEVASSDLWVSVWKAFGDCASGMTEEDSDVKCALVKTVSVLYQSARSNEFKEEERMDQLLKLLENIIIGLGNPTGDANRSGQGSKTAMTSAAAIWRDTLGVLKDLPPLIEEGVWVNLILSVVRYRQMNHIPRQIIREVNRAFVALYNEGTPFGARAQTFSNILFSLNISESDAQLENTSTLEALNALITFGLPSTASLSDRNETERLWIELLKTIERFTANPLPAIDSKGASGNWDLMLLELVAKQITDSKGPAVAPISAQELLLSILVSGSGILHHGKLRQELPLRRPFMDGCLSQIVSLCMTESSELEIRKRAFDSFLNCAQEALAWYIMAGKDSSSQEVAMSHEVATRVLHHIESIVSNESSCKEGRVLVLKLFPLICECIVSIHQDVRSMVRTVLLAARISELVHRLES